MNGLMIFTGLLLTLGGAGAVEASTNSMDMMTGFALSLVGVFIMFAGAAQIEN